MQNDGWGETSTVERIIGGWYGLIRFAAISVLWAVTAWPIVTMPLSAAAAMSAWQSDAELVPWRAYWQGFMHGAKSYVVGVPWMIGLAITGLELAVSTHAHYLNVRAVLGLFAALEGLVTVWACYAWSAMAMGFATEEAMRVALLGVLRHPTRSALWIVVLVATISLGIFWPFTIPLLWGGTLAVVGRSGAQEFFGVLT